MGRLVGIVITLAIVGAGPAAGGDGTYAEGFVFEDLDGDGRRDSGEPGIAGVPVSNGLDVVLTGADGAYRLAAGGPIHEVEERWFLDGVWQDDPPRVVEPEWLNVMDNLAGAIRDGAPLVADGRTGRRTQAVLDGMYRSAYEADGAWVDVQPEL